MRTKKALYAKMRQMGWCCGISFHILAKPYGDWEEMTGPEVERIDNNFMRALRQVVDEIEECEIKNGV